MKPDWILIANASRARLLQQEQGGRLRELHAFEHPASRLHSSQLGSDERGREAADRSFGAAAYEPRLDLQRKEHQRFARELAEHLDQGVQQGQCGSVRLFAASPFLGELKAQLADATLRVLAGCHDLDLSAVGPAELGRRIAQALTPAE